MPTKPAESLTPQAFFQKSRLVIPALVFAVAFLVRMIGINQVGQLTPEIKLMQTGNQLLQDLNHRAVQSLKAYTPIVPSFLYGLVGRLDIDRFDEQGQPQFNYDWTWARLLAAIISSATAMFIYLIGKHWFNRELGLVAALFFSLQPLSVGYGQIINSQVVSLFFITLTVAVLTIPHQKRLMFASLTSLLAIGSMDWQSASQTVLLNNQLIHTPFYYPLVRLAVATPAILLALFSLGLVKLIVEWNHSSSKYLGTWVAGAFVTSLAHQSTPTLFLLAPLSVLSAYALQGIVQKTISPESFSTASVLAAVSLIFSLSQVYPYYLTFFNHLTGGTSQVYKLRTFDIGFNGEGLRAAGVWLVDHAEPKSVIGIAALPDNDLPPLDDVLVVPYTDRLPYDYIVLSTSKIMQENFDPRAIYEKYNPMHQIQVDGAPLVTIFKRKALEPVVSTMQIAPPSNK